MHHQVPQETLDDFDKLGETIKRMGRWVAKRGALAIAGSQIRKMLLLIDRVAATLFCRGTARSLHGIAPFTTLPRMFGVVLSAPSRRREN